MFTVGYTYYTFLLILELEIINSLSFNEKKQLGPPSQHLIWGFTENPLKMVYFPVYA